MTLLSKTLFDHCDVEVSSSTDTEERDIQDPATVNPASGLPMIKGSVVDVAGNPLGTDFTEEQTSLPSFQDIENHMTDSFSCDLIHAHSETIFECETSSDTISGSFDNTWDNGFAEY